MANTTFMDLMLDKGLTIQNKRSLWNDDRGAGVGSQILGLALAALAAATLLPMFQESSQNIDNSAVKDDFNLLALKVQKKYRRQPAYPTGDFTAQIGPDLGDSWWDGTNINNRYGGTVTYTGAISNGLNVAQLSQTAIPISACVDMLLTEELGTGMYKQVSVNGGTAITSTVSSDATAKTACSSDRNTMIFEVYKR